MIALDREMPVRCFDCPCFKVLSASGENGKVYVIQYCSEAERIIRKYDTSCPRPSDWFYEGRMEWCRWMEKK